MGEIGVDTMAEAARRYAGLRRRYWRSYLCGYGVFAVLGLPIFAFGSVLPPGISDALLGALMPAFLACYVVTVVSFMGLSRFRCPRCGGRFVMSRLGWWP